MQIRKAERRKVKLKLKVSGPSGSGKTMGALKLAKGLVGDWSKIVLIDSENGSGELYSHLGEYSVLPITSPFSPEKYIEAIKMCEAAGYECIIIDSASHEWDGKGGCLEINEKLAKTTFKGNSWAAWSETTPRHQKFIDTMLQSPAHIIASFRSKTESVMSDDKKVKKMGMKDVGREGTDYEFTVSLDIDRETHLALVSKDRTNLFEGKDSFTIEEETGVLIKKWCELGLDVPKEATPSDTPPATNNNKPDFDPVKYQKDLLDKLVKLKNSTIANLDSKIKNLNKWNAEVHSDKELFAAVERLDLFDNCIKAIHSDLEALKPKPTPAPEVESEKPPASQPEVKSEQSSTPQPEVKISSPSEQKQEDECLF